MARSTPADQAPISLFPMFNILVATLGVLVFVQIAVVVVSLGIGKAIVFVPAASEERIAREPVYVELVGSSLTLHPDGVSVELAWDLDVQQTWEELWAHYDALLAGTAFEQIFEEVRAEDSSRYLIAVIRPSAFAWKDFYILRGYLREREIPFGYEPLEEGVEFRGR